MISISKNGPTYRFRDGVDVSSGRHSQLGRATEHQINRTITLTSLISAAAQAETLAELIEYIRDGSTMSFQPIHQSKGATK